MTDASSPSSNSLTTERLRQVRDPIHDFINLSPRLSSFVDTRQFQRLRYIKQLGVSYYVWPGASHNRFEHCLGVAHLARLMAKHLQDTQPELNITDRDVECIEIAGLCHDLGHGPWSHVWDNIFIPTAMPERRWKHETGSEKMFDYLVEDNEINISQEDCTFIKALIVCEPERCKHEKPFLFEIVSNRRNGIDVDKFDYILRDSHAVGEKGNLSLTRLILSARVIDNQICYDIKDANQIYELCYTRFTLHKRIYNHKTAKAIEYMLVDALIEADPYLQIAARIDNPEKFVYLADDILSEIERSEEPALANARKIIKRIRTRDLYRLVDSTYSGWEYRQVSKDICTPERIFKKAMAGATPKNENADPLSERDIIVDLTEMHYGMKEKNPMDFVRFYSKHNPNQSAKAGSGDISLLMPASFGEILLRVYTRKAEHMEIIQKGFRVVLQEMSSLNRVLDLAVGESVLTPPATEAPETPQAFSRKPSDIFPGSGESGQSPQSSQGGRSGSFSVNIFNTIPKDYVPPSPTRRSRRSKIDKDALEEDIPSKKRRR